MFKVVVLLKRRAGLSVEEFVAHYESHHAKLGEERLRGSVVKYVRRYLTPLTRTADAVPAESEFDVLMEMWFESAEIFRATMGPTAPMSDLRALIAEDEKFLFDRERIRMFTVDERESVI